MQKLSVGQERKFPVKCDHSDAVSAGTGVGGIPDVRFCSSSFKLATAGQAASGEASGRP